MRGMGARGGRRSGCDGACTGGPPTDRARDQDQRTKTGKNESDGMTELPTT